MGDGLLLDSGNVARRQTLVSCGNYPWIFLGVDYSWGEAVFGCRMFLWVGCFLGEAIFGGRLFLGVVLGGVFGRLFWGWVFCGVYCSWGEAVLEGRLFWGLGCSTDQFLRE